MRRMNALRACGAGLLVVSLAGCMKIDMQLELQSDDTVDGSMVFALSKDVSDMAAMMGEDPDALFDEMDTGDLPEDTEVEEYEEGDFVGQRYVFNGTDLSEFAESEDGFGIVHEGEEFVVNGEMDMSDMDMSDMQDMEGLEGELGDDMGSLGDPSAMMESVEISLSINFPGEVIEHNGELDGTTVTWTPQPGENLEISARAEDSGGGGGGAPVWVWIIIAVVVVAGLAALLYFISRGRSADTSQSPEGSMPPPPPARMVSSTTETQMGEAEAAATEVAADQGQSTRPTGTPAGAEDSELDTSAGRPESPPPAPDTGDTTPGDTTGDTTTGDTTPGDTTGDTTTGDTTPGDTTPGDTTGDTTRDDGGSENENR